MGNTRDDLAEILFQSFLTKAIIVRSSGECKKVHSSDIVNSAFYLPTTVPPTLQGALMDEFVEPVIVHDKFLSMQVSAS